MRELGWIAIATLIGCGSVKDRDPDAAAPIDTPTDTPGDTAQAACDPTKPFGAPVQVPVIHDANGNDTHATLTADELTLYFASDRQGNNIFHIFSATRATVTDPFGTPALVGETFTSQGESHPSISPDGNTIYFDSFRVSAGTVHIFTATRSSTAVQFPQATMISGDFLIDPAITLDGSVLYAANLQSGGLVRMDRSGSGFGPPQGVSLQAPSSIVSPVTNDDLTMFMAFGDTTGNTIAATRRPSTTTGFPAPTGVGELATGSAVAEPSWVSADGCRIYLTYGITGQRTTIFTATRPR